MHREPDVGVSASSLLSFLHGEACAEHGDVLDLAWLQLYPLESQRWALRDGGGGGSLASSVPSSSCRRGTIQTPCPAFRGDGSRWFAPPGEENSLLEPWQSPDAGREHPGGRPRGHGHAQHPPAPGSCALTAMLLQHHCSAGPRSSLNRRRHMKASKKVALFWEKNKK